MATTSARFAEDPRIEILGVPIDSLTMDRCLDRIGQFIDAGTPHQIVTADSSGIVQSQTDPDLRALYQEADLVTADSAGVLWAAKRRGTPLPERVSGVDIVNRVCARSADTGWRIYFLGSSPGIAALAADKLRLKHPGCNIVGARDGYFPSESDEVVASEIAEFRPDVLFVGMGIPRQEKFIRATRDIVGAKVALGVGGSFDVFSGKVARAPAPFQRLHLEWLWRLLQDPKKISKVKLLPRFVRLILRSPKS